MSELTVEYGQLPICVNCQLKHTVGLLHHIDPDLEKGKYKKIRTLVNSIGSDLEMTSKQIEDLIRINEFEHRVEDALTVVRDLRQKGTIGAGEAEKNIEKLHMELRKVRHDVVDGSGCIGGTLTDGKCLLKPMSHDKHKNLSRRAYIK